MNKVEILIIKMLTCNFHGMRGRERKKVHCHQFHTYRIKKKTADMIKEYFF